MSQSPPDRKSRKASKRKLAAQPVADELAHSLFDSPSCLLVIYGPEMGRRAPVGTRPFLIGRAPKSDMWIDSDSVSRNHARIHFDRDLGHVIADLGSTNGTLVNDRPVAEAILVDGDQVRIGRSILKFMTGENIEASYNEEVYRMMTVDALTRAFNHRYFAETLERECSRAKRYRRELSLILIDVDGFRQVNELHGHVMGDAVLRQLAEAIGAQLRREDVFARIAGEEFAILLPEVGMDGARILGERIRRAVVATPFSAGVSPVALAISGGVATLDPKAPLAPILLRAAEGALARAKNGGRNRVEG